MVTSDTVTVTTKKPDGYSFDAGQYAVVRVTTKNGQSLIRQYSFSSAPRNDGLELLVQHEPDGEVSTWFCRVAKVGDVIEISQPFGGFTLAGIAGPTLLIAGRVGIAPFISMMRESSSQALSLLYSVRSEEQVCFPELLTAHKTTIIKTGEMPRIDRAMLEAHIGLDPVVFVCGSKQFVDGICSELKELGVPEHDIRRELFTLQ